MGFSFPIRQPRFSRLLQASILVIACAFGLLTTRAATLTWTGLAGDGNIATPGNWSPAQAPVTGDILIFAGSTSLAPQRASNLSLGAISFAGGASAFTLGGAGTYTISTAAGITNSSANTQTINNAIDLGAAQTWTASAGALTFGGAIDTKGFALTIDGAANTTMSGVIIGSGSLTKNGAGTLTLSGAADNTFTGTTTVNAGTVLLAKTGGKKAIKEAIVIGDGVGADIVRYSGADQIDNGLITVNSSGLLDLNNFNDTVGALQLNGGAITTGTGILTLGGNVTTGASSTTATISGNLSLGTGDRIFTVADGSAADDLAISAVISGDQRLTKQGTGTLVLSGANTFSRDAVIDAGVVRAENGSALGTVKVKVETGAALQLQGGITIGIPVELSGTGIANDGALRNLSGNNTISGNLKLNASSTIASDSGTLTLSGGLDGGGGGKSFTFAGAGNTTVTGVISNNGSVTMNGTGVLTLSGVNTYSGGSIINSGTVVVNNAASLGAAGVAATINAGILQVASTFTSGRNFTLGSSSSTIQVDAGQTFTVPTIFSGSGALNKTGAGTLLLSGVNTHTGGTNVSAGTLRLGASERLANTGALTVSGGTFDLQTYNETVGAVTLASGAITGTGTATLTASSYALQSGSASAILAGSGAVTKTTSGTVTLTGANTLSGSTTVSGGNVTLAAASGSALGSTSSVTVNAGGTLMLGASNQINNSAGLTLAGGTFAKGNFSEGATNAAGVGALTLTATNSRLDFGTGTVGVLSFASFSPGSFALTIDNWTGTIATQGNLTTDRLIFNSDQTANLSSFSFSGYGPGATQFSLGGGCYEIVPVIPVPEPATYVAGALAAFVLFRAELRRRRRVDHKKYDRSRELPLGP